MRPITLVCLLLTAVWALPGCNTPEKTEKRKAKKEEAAEKAAEKARKKPKIPDATQDTNFQAFVGRLRTAVALRDRTTLQSMLAPDFGWRWENPQPGSPFEYWDQQHAWGELEKLLGQRFTPSESFMVAPPEFASDPNYRGYRIGLRQVNGSWRLAYFVTGEDLAL
jgi:hypothetical protein